MTESHLVCRADKTCDIDAIYLLPLKKAAGDVGWIPVCWEHAEGWFKTRPVIGEVLEVDAVSDDDKTRQYLGIPAKQVPECNETDAPDAGDSSAS